MSDTRLRELERAWRVEGDHDARVALLAERVRQGEVSQQTLDGFSYLGHRAARRLTEHDDVCTSESCGRKISEHPIPASELRGETLSCPGYPLRSRSWSKWWRGFMEHVPGDMAWRAMLHVAMREAARNASGRATQALSDCVQMIDRRDPWESLVLRASVGRVTSWHVLPIQTVVAWVLRGRIEELGADRVPGYNLIHTVVDDRFPCPMGFHYLVSQENGLDRIRAELRSWINRRETW